MKRDVLRLIPAFALIVLVATALAFWRKEPTVNFDLDVVAGEGIGDRVSLEGLRGHIVVLEFWASWCSACRLSAPQLNEVHAHFDGRLQFYGVTSEGLPAPDIRVAHERFGYTFPTLRDDQGVAESLGVEGLPTLIVIGTEGELLHHQIGTMPASELVALIESFVDSTYSLGDDS